MLLSDIIFSFLEEFFLTLLTRVHQKSGEFNEFTSEALTAGTPNFQIDKNKPFDARIR